MTAGAAKQPTFSGPLVTTSVDRVARPNPFTAVPILRRAIPSLRRGTRSIIRTRCGCCSSCTSRRAPLPIIRWSTSSRACRTKTRGAASTEEVRHAEFKDGRLLKSKIIAVNDLENGDYRLIVNLRQKGSAAVLASSNTPLRIAPDKAEIPLYFLADTQGLGRPGVTAYMRALEAISQKNDAAAADYFRQALDAEPRQCLRRTVAGPALFQRAEIYADRGSVQACSGSRLSRVLRSRWPQIALSFRQSGDAAGASGVISAGLGLFPGNSTLAALQTRGR